MLNYTSLTKTRNWSIFTFTKVKKVILSIMLAHFYKHIQCIGGLCFVSYNCSFFFILKCMYSTSPLAKWQPNHHHPLYDPAISRCGWMDGWIDKKQEKISRKLFLLICKDQKSFLNDHSHVLIFKHVILKLYKILFMHNIKTYNIKSNMLLTLS